MYTGNTLSLPEVLLGSNDQTISDDIGERGRFRGVIHEKNNFELFPCPVTQYHEYDGTGRHEVLSGQYCLWHFFGALPRVTGSRLMSSYEATTQQLLNKAASGFYQTNKVDSLLNMIEFRQLSQSLTTAKSWMAQFEGLYHTVPSLRRRLGKRWISRSMRDLNSLFLGYSFGVAPLLSDVRRIDRELLQAPGVIDRLGKRRRRIVSTARAQGQCSVSLSDISGYASTPPTTPDGSWWHSDVTSDVYKIVGVGGTDSLQFESEGFQILHNALSRYGATGPASLAWELVPFSFVLDWFIDVSPVIDAMDQALTGQTKTIDTKWVTEKFDVKIRYFKHRCRALSTSSQITLHDWPQDGTQIGYSNIVKYHRQRLPLSPTVTGSGRFGKKQGVLAGSLLYQKVANLLRLARR